MIRPATLTDAEAICGIYNYYVLNTHFNFEEETVSVDEMQHRIEKIIRKLPWLVYEQEGKLVGYAYASEWKSRCSYRYSVESSIYLKHGESGNGIGSKLYGALLGELEKLEVHAIIGGVAQPNDASIALHEKFGFEKVAHFKQVGFKFNKWIDVAYWEKLLNYEFKPS
jgi:L-amino acid N-acyltransferase YncA